MIKKIVINYATMLDGGWPNEHPEYELAWSIPDGNTAEEEDRIAESHINKIRRILGWKDIEL